MNYKQYLKEIMYLVQDDRKGILKLSMLFLFSAFLDLIGIGLIVPFITMLTSPEGVIFKEVSSIFIYFKIYVDNQEIIILSGLLLVFVFIIKALISILVYKVILSYCFNKGIYLRTHLMKSYQSLEYVDFIQKSSSEYIYKIHHAVELFYREILQPLLKSISDGMVVLFILAYLAWFDFKAFALLLGLLAVGVYLYDSIFRNKLKVYGEKVNTHSTQIVKNISESILGFKEIRALGKEQFFYNTVKTAAINHAEASKNSEIIANLPRFILEVLIIIFIVLLSFIAILSNSGIEGFIPMLGLFGVASIRLMPSSNAVINGLSKLRFGRNTVHLLYKDLKELKNNRLNKKIGPEESDSFRSLVLDNISFSYPDQNREALNNISININSGDTIGIMGPSGSGKTTVVDIMLGFLTPSSGNIYYNNEKVTGHGELWKSRIAYLPQHAFIIDDSIKNNIALGVSDIEFDEKMLIKSIKYAQLEDVIHRMPNGVQTELGERGVKLSGGEMQRVSIARAFYHSRDVLIMDESTNALDKENESKVVEVIARHNKNKTIIIIAHRLSTLRYCNRIYLFENGEVIESGDYKKIVLDKEDLT